MKRRDFLKGVAAAAAASAIPAGTVMAAPKIGRYPEGAWVSGWVDYVPESAGPDMRLWVAMQCSPDGEWTNYLYTQRPYGVEPEKPNGDYWLIYPDWIVYPARHLRQYGYQG